jgi:hypothetical protein
MKTKQTAAEWLHEQLLKILIDNQIQQTYYLFDQAKAMEKQQQDQLAIDFAEWLSNLKYNERRYKTNEESLEIYKKEKGL